jgi:hypothetical protein
MISQKKVGSITKKCNEPRLPNPRADQFRTQQLALCAASAVEFLVEEIINTCGAKWAFF